MIKRFKITGLFGFRNVDINFEDNVKILIGENGFGKTTILNSLYYLLNKKYAKLSNIEFETMELNFQNEESLLFYIHPLLYQSSSAILHQLYYPLQLQKDGEY